MVERLLDHLVEQLICIGDPQQLRPTLATYRKQYVPSVTISLLLAPFPA